MNRMSNPTEDNPNWFDKLSKISFKDPELETLRRELISAMRNNILTSAVMWDKIKKNQDRLAKEANDKMNSLFDWPIYQLLEIEEASYYKKLKEEQAGLFADFLVKMCERQKDMETVVEPALDLDMVNDKLTELMLANPNIPLRGKKSVYEELSKIFPDSSELIEEVITIKESEGKDDGQHS